MQECDIKIEKSGLQKKLDADYYAIIDITNKPKKFFMDQNLIDFKQIWFYHDEINNSGNKQPDINFLKEFENKYDINLWNLALNERIFYRFYNFHKFTDNEILNIEEKSIRFFERVLNQIKPDYFITKVPSFHHLELFSQMCKKRGVKNLILSQPNIGYRCIISEVVSKLDSFSSIDNITTQNLTFEELQNYLKSFDISKQISKYNKQHANSKKDWFKALIDYLLSENVNVKTQTSRVDDINF